MTDSTPPDGDVPRPATHSDGRHRLLPRDQDASRTLILLMIASLLLIVAGVYYAVERSDLADNVLGEPAAFDLNEPIMELDDILRESQKRNLLGREVALWGVPVVQVAGDYMYWLGIGRRRSVPVVLLGERTSRQHEVETAVRGGDTLAVFGTIRAVREVLLLDREWAMEPEEWERLEQATIYVSALRVEHLARAERPGPRTDEAGR